MKYIFDTGVISRITEHYYIETFPSFWTKFNEYLKEYKIISVKEVKNELKSWGLYEQHKKLINNIAFEDNNNAELTFVRDLFASNIKYQDLVSQKNILAGRPTADPYLIAKANYANSCLVTMESYQGKKINIPSVCRDYEIRYTNLEGFMKKEGWVF